MLVYGYTEGKMVVPADLPIELIARLRIDPWRLDLFDPEPAKVRCKIGSTEETLNFRKLHDLSFAYQIFGGPTFICMRDGSGEHCVWSNETVNDDGLRLKNFQPSLRPFHEHFAEYLQLLGHMNQILERLPPRSEPQLPQFVLYDAKHKPFTEIQGADLVFLSGVAWTHHHKNEVPWNPLEPVFQFGGEMFTTLPVPTVLPDEINWALQQFEQWEPMVIGEGLRPFKEHLNKDVFLLFNETDYPEALNEIDRVAKVKDKREPHFIKGDWTFRLSLKDGIVSDPLLLLCPGLSIDTKQCIRANEVQMSRICLFDIAMGQARLMDRLGDQMKLILPEEGLKCIPHIDELDGLDAANLARPV
jgi:hypothetical protein